MANIAKFSPEPPFKNFQKALFINDLLKVFEIPKNFFQKFFGGVQGQSPCR